MTSSESIHFIGDSIKEGCGNCGHSCIHGNKEEVKCPQIWHRPQGMIIPRLTPVAKKEAKRVATLFWPVSCTHFLIFFIPLSSTFFLGHLGKTNLAAAGLALAITNVTGLSIGFGLSMGLDTLMNQAIGAKNYRRVGILLQRAILILAIALLPVIGLWLNIKHVLLAIKQHSNVAELTEEFVFYYVPSLLFHAFYQVLEKFLVCQKIVIPLIVSSFFGVLVNALFSYLFIFVFSMGMRGGALSINLAYLSMCIFVIIAIKVKGWHKKAWPGWSWECLEDWGEFAKFALPTLAMICIEWWSFEIGTLIIGTKGDIQLAAQTITFNLATTNFMFTMGFAVAATVQVGSYLGAGRPEMALLSSHIATLFTVSFLGCIMLVLLLTRNYIGYIFTSNQEVIALTAGVIPFTAVFGLMDGFQCVSSGVIRGAGLQRIGVLINFIGYDIFAVPLAIVLSLVLNLLIKGIWIGLACGLVLQCVAFRVVIARMDWSKQSKKAISRSTAESSLSADIPTTAAAGNPSHAEECGTELTELVPYATNPESEAAEHKDCEGESKTDKLIEASSSPEDNSVPQVKTPTGKELLLRRILIFLVSFSILVAAIIVRVFVR